MPHGPLHVACFEGNLATVIALLDSGAAINEPDAQSGNTPLMLAIENLQVEIVRLLLERGADPNASGYGGTTPLQLAIDAEVEAAKLSAADEAILGTVVGVILRAGGAPSKKDDVGSDAYTWATRTGHVKALEMMKEASTHR